MPIQSDDLKILKSAVMADVPEGGGGMTGAPIVDGLSNNVFNDISADDRAHGDWSCIKGFGIAHTDDTDTLLGSGWVVLKPPEDPRVSVMTFETSGWFDERTHAVALVESALVKAPRLLCRVQDTHYTGVSLLQLYNPAPGESFPKDGDAVVIRNPNGAEQRVRALRVTITRNVSVFDDAGEYKVNLATCELSRPLTMDVLGKPPQRSTPSSSTTATVFSTAPAAGAKFHGVKPLAEAVVLGAQPIRSVKLAGGIFQQLVPSTTVPTPVTDIYPLVQRPTLSRTATAPLQVTAAAVALTAGTVLQLPTAAEPGQLNMTHGGTSFTTNPAGDLLQGTTKVGEVSWSGRTITMGSSAPNYGSATNTITYKPATVTGATAHSMAIEVTEANRSTAIVRVLEPTPAPGTLTISYMVQGQWYEISDDGTGKLVGADSSYGSGNLTFVTGSILATIPLPDIGSVIILTWGEADSARTATGLPTRAKALIALAKLPQAGTLAISYPVGAATRNVTVAANGTVTGPAQVGTVKRNDDTGRYEFEFSPDEIPTGPVTCNYTASNEELGFTNDGGGVYTLDQPPLESSVRFTIVGASGTDAKAYKAHTIGTDVYIGTTLIGQINNITGVMTLNGASTISVTTHVETKVQSGNIVEVI
jgi:hypothetical protein